jgi:hypothetical protein
VKMGVMSESQSTAADNSVKLYEEIKITKDWYIEHIYNGLRYKSSLNLSSFLVLSAQFDRKLPSIWT